MEFQKNKQDILQSVTTDKRRILQLLLNFISNSIKFSNQDGIIKILLNVVNEYKMESSLD